MISDNNDYCVIGKLKMTEVEGAKTLKLGHWGGLTFAISKDLDPDKLYAIFLPDGQLSEEYFEANKEDLGFFGKNRKVRSINLMRGRISSAGYVALLDSLKYTGYDISLLKDGDSFNDLNGVPVCNKFINRRLQYINVGGKKVNARREYPDLLMHYDTNQFYKIGKYIKKNSLITITLKMDGTSFRAANHKEIRELSWYEKLLNKFVPIKNHSYKHVCGSRRVIMSKDSNNYYDTDLYSDMLERLGNTLYPGESIYGEIVGWQNHDKPLFERGGVKFKYGCVPGHRDLYIYNIKWTLPNGYNIDLPWYKIKQRCFHLGLNHVPEILPTFRYDGSLSKLSETVFSYVDGADLVDPSHIREGVVIRVDDTNGKTFFLKAKSQKFYELEDAFKNDGNVDIEETN